MPNIHEEIMHLKKGLRILRWHAKWNECIREQMEEKIEENLHKIRELEATLKDHE